MAKHNTRPVTPARIGLAVAVGVGTVSAVLAVAGAGFLVAVARRVVTPPTAAAEDLDILATTPDSVTLTSTRDTRLAGRYSLWFSGGTGHARLGDVLATTPTTVTRRVIGVDAGNLDYAARARIGSWYYLDPSGLTLPYSEVAIPTPIGPAPAWLIPAAAAEHTASAAPAAAPSPAAAAAAAAAAVAPAAVDSAATGPAAPRRWMIGVHGRGVRRAETLRGVESFYAAGYTSLLVSYRNDGDAPASADGLYALGDTEWEDVDAAIGFARERGATDIVLMGWSMGGATVLQAATRSQHAHLIRGIILESPVVDWITALNHQGKHLGYANPFRRGSLSVLSRSWGGRVTGQSQPIDLARLNFVYRSAELTVPILLMHSADDAFVPPTASRALALLRPDIVRYEEFTLASHTRLWNLDPVRWESCIREFLRDLVVARAGDPLAAVEHARP